MTTDREFPRIDGSKLITGSQQIRGSITHPTMYVSPAGSGDLSGRDASNRMNKDRLRDIITEEGRYQFYLAAGTYHQLGVPFCTSVHMIAEGDLVFTGGTHFVQGLINIDDQGTPRNITLDAAYTLAMNSGTLICNGTLNPASSSGISQLICGKIAAYKGYIVATYLNCSRFGDVHHSYFELGKLVLRHDVVGDSVLNHSGIICILGWADGDFYVPGTVANKFEINKSHVTANTWAVTLSSLRVHDCSSVRLQGVTFCSVTGGVSVSDASSFRVDVSSAHWNIGDWLELQACSAMMLASTQLNVTLGVSVAYMAMLEANGPLTINSPAIYCSQGAHIGGGDEILTSVPAVNAGSVVNSASHGVIKG